MTDLSVKLAKQDRVRDYPVRKYIKRKLKTLTVEDKVAIINEIHINKASHDFTARFHRVSRSTVRYLIKKVKKCPQYIKELTSADI